MSKIVRQLALTAAALLATAASLALLRERAPPPPPAVAGGVAAPAATSAPRSAAVIPPRDLAGTVAQRDAAGDLLATLTHLDDLSRHSSGGATADATFLFDAYSAAIDRALDGRNFDTVRAILETTPRADVRALLLAAFADVWARTAPAEAAAWVAASAPLAPDRARVLSGVMTTWAARDPTAAGAFAEALPPGDARRAALGSVTLQWRGSDFAAAAAWVSDHPPHADFDSALAALATAPRLVSADPAAAISWAERIASAETRREAIATIARQWAVSDATTPSPLDSSLTPAQRAWLNEVLTARKADGGS